jgi:cholesterol transport system auxiliary component
MKLLGAVAASVLVAGCVNVLPEAGPAPQIYRLEGAPPVVQAMTASVVPIDADYAALTVVVPEPLASRALSSDRVAVMTSGDHLSYAAGARWSERAPLVVQNRVLLAFEDDGRIGAAVRPEDGVQTDYELRLDMIRFEAVYRNGDSAAPTAIVDLRAKLIDRRSRDLVASRRFDAEETAGENRLGSIIAAFDGAMNQIAPQLVDWTLTSPRTAAQPSASAASSSR